MAGQKKAVLCGPDAVITWYEGVKQGPYYSIWNKREKMFVYRETDEEKGLQILRDTLEAAEQNGITDILNIRVHPVVEKDGYITDKTPYDYNMPFTVVSEYPGHAVANQMPFNAANQLYRETLSSKNDKIIEKLDLLLTKQSSFEARLNALEEGEDDNDQPTGLNGVLAGILQKPETQNMLLGLIGNLFGNRPGAVLAGAPNDQDEKIKAAIERLKRVDEKLGDDLLSLAKLAETNPIVWQALLTQLRTL
jgi:hypothetical protein